MHDTSGMANLMLLLHGIILFVSLITLTIALRAYSALQKFFHEINELVRKR
jgi:hypothetical protein